ncbi:MAG: hypothetical protein CL424_12110 [Acidimicrobiaceae bacterium]|nr:hypothetical protein [Acidimicrobiaceae bacterium]
MPAAVRAPIDDLGGVGLIANAVAVSRAAPPRPASQLDLDVVGLRIGQMAAAQHSDRSVKPAPG